MEVERKERPQKRPDSLTQSLDNDRGLLIVWILSPRRDCTIACTAFVLNIFTYFSSSLLSLVTRFDIFGLTFTIVFAEFIIIMCSFFAILLLFKNFFLLFLLLFPFFFLMFSLLLADVAVVVVAFLYSPILALQWKSKWIEIFCLLHIRRHPLYSLASFDHKTLKQNKFSISCLIDNITNKLFTSKNYFSLLILLAECATHCIHFILFFFFFLLLFHLYYCSFCVALISGRRVSHIVF